MAAIALVLGLESPISLPCLPAVAEAKSNGLRSTDRCSHVAVRRLPGNRTPPATSNIGFDSWRSGRLFVCHYIAENSLL
jgi:hypothetical protein